MFRVFATTSVVGCAGNSFESCNTKDAHFKHMKITSSPDPPVLGQDVTLTLEGSLDKAVTSGVANINIKAGIIKFPLKVPFKNNVPSADFVSGQKVVATLGPFKYPNIRVPLIKMASGKIEVTDQDGEQVSCATFNLPAYSETAPVAIESSPPFVDCSGDGAHVKNRQLDVEPPVISKGKPFTVRGKGDLDEDISSGNMDLQIDLSLFKFGITSPFSISPPVKAAHADMTVGPLTMPKIPAVPHAKGSLKMTDHKVEELVCMNFNLPVMNDIAV